MSADLSTQLFPPDCGASVSQLSEASQRRSSRGQLLMDPNRQEDANARGEGNGESAGIGRDGTSAATPLDLCSSPASHRKPGTSSKEAGLLMKVQLPPPHSSVGIGNLQPNNLLSAFTSDLEQLRKMMTCYICFRMLYEPYTLCCGHTFCYTCLCKWFEGPQKMSCPECRKTITQMPAPAYLVKEVVNVLMKQPELLPKGETLEENEIWRQEAIDAVEADKAATGPKPRGLFKGRFDRFKNGVKAFRDPEDNVLRCPDCGHEIEDNCCDWCGMYFSGSDVLGSDFSDNDYDDYDMDDGMEVDTWGDPLSGEEEWGISDLPPSMYETGPLVPSTMRPQIRISRRGMASASGGHESMDDDEDDDDDDGSSDSMRSFISYSDDANPLNAERIHGQNSMSSSSGAESTLAGDVATDDDLNATAGVNGANSDVAEADGRSMPAVSSYRQHPSPFPPSEQSRRRVHLSLTDSEDDTPAPEHAARASTPSINSEGGVSAANKDDAGEDSDVAIRAVRRRRGRNRAGR